MFKSTPENKLSYLIVFLRIVLFSCFQEFECGVSVEGSDKQEWSFTLYDFDGRGKITKDVRLPHYMVHVKKWPFEVLN